MFAGVRLSELQALLGRARSPACRRDCAAILRRLAAVAGQDHVAGVGGHRPVDDAVPVRRRSPPAARAARGGSAFDCSIALLCASTSSASCVDLLVEIVDLARGTSSICFLSASVSSSVARARRALPSCSCVRTTRARRSAG